MIETTSPKIGKELEKALAKNGYGFTYSSRFRYNIIELLDMLPKDLSIGIFRNSSHHFITNAMIRATLLVSKIEMNLPDSLARLVLWCIENEHKLNLPKND